MTGSTEILIGARSQERLIVRLWSRARPAGLRPLDNDWLYAELLLRTQASSFRFPSFLRRPDFVAFAAELTAVAAGQTKEARFEPRDPWLWIDLRREDDDRFRVEVRAREAGCGRAVGQVFVLDKDAVARLADEVAEVGRAFPMESENQP